MGEWAAWLKSQGYVALIVDSFSPRGSTNACQGQSPQVAEAAQDSIDALAHLKSLPFVDANLVAVMGWSHGGSAALEATSSRGPRWSGSNDRLSFHAAVAFYPACRSLDGQTTTPTLLLLAGRDDWTPPEWCRETAEAAPKSVRPVWYELYPNAQHAFDRPSPKTTYLGHTMAYDGDAAAASRLAVQAFLAEQLQDKHQ